MHPFFAKRDFDCCGQETVGLDCKLLMALKVNAYGVAANAFRDYFQMGESTARKCCELLNEALMHCKELTTIYLRKMTKADAQRVAQLHFVKHGIHGMLGCLDCMHVVWKNCPVALQGAFTGKEGTPTLVLEAMSDFNLWIWHASFGFAGALNDLNIWENSSLLQDMVNGTMAMLDFEFWIGGKRFTKLFFLVDGIYPETARFVKTVSVPSGHAQKKFCAWQEATRKNIERAFGVLQRKFQILCHPLEKWDERRINQTVMACILMHNMMVQERVNSESDPFENFCGMYDPDDDEHENEQNLENCDQNDGDDASVDDDAAEHVLRVEAEVLHRSQIIATHRVADRHVYDGIVQHELLRIALLPQTTRIIQQRWQNLYDVEEHKRLQHAIMDELNKTPADD